MALSPLWSWFRKAWRGPPAADASQRVERPFFPGSAADMVDAYRPLIEDARALTDGTPCGAPLLAAITAEITRRRTITGTLAGPADPGITDLVVRHTGLPDWWHAHGNLLVCGADTEVNIGLGFWQTPCRNCLAVIGSDTAPPRLIFEGEGGLVVIGDGCRIINSGFNITGESTILIGENSTATHMASIDVRNGGIVVVGDDNMWAMGVGLMSDDTHAIRDAVTDRRINEFGGKIVIERHVWIGNSVQLMGHSYIGHDSVIGQGSFVSNMVLPPQTVSAGRPARPRRSGITWSRQDLP